MNESEWASSIARFRRSFIANPQDYFKDEDEKEQFWKDIQKGVPPFVFYPSFVLFAKRNGYLPINGSDADGLRELTDLRLPHEWFPKAAAMKRRIIYHGGPTNSGKTYEALQRLKEAGEGGGMYCGPLRLLALEIYETLNLAGVYCSLVTGEEKREIPCSTHVSCTVEMCSASNPYEVAVVDEIQMIGDPQRGWAWTRALFCLQAKEIHVCGSMEAVELVRKIAEVSGDDFELNTYERRSPLEIEKTSLTSYSKIRPGDCVVAFSRRNVFQIKREIEKTTGLKCCIVYGQLPPETRSQQARLFNTKGNGYDVLVASDAIGMGLNLNIRRVIFDSMKKYDGADMVDITPSLTKQIAGRAGRYGSEYAEGVATCLLASDQKYFQEAYFEKPVELKSAGLFPSSEQMEEFAKQLPGITDLGDLLDKYVMLARLDGDYFMCNHSDMKQAATLLQNIDLDLSDRFTFCMAPTNLRTPLGRKIFVDYATAHSNNRAVPLDIFLPKYAPETELALRDVEIKAKIIDVYLWLSYRFEGTFVEHEDAKQMKERVLQLVEQGLINTTYNKEKEEEAAKEREKRQLRRYERENQYQNSNGNFMKSNSAWNIWKIKGNT